MIAARDVLAVLALIAALAVVSLLIFAGIAHAQTASCTSLTIGQTQDITAFSVCKKVTLNSVPPPSAGVAGICVPTNIDAAQWASFYNNPPTGVTIADCSGGCTGYSYGGYCYYYSGDGVSNTCDTTCASYGGCSLAGTRYIGSDDSGSTRCTAVATALAGTTVSVVANTGADAGCGMITYKGGWVGYNQYSPATTCASGGLFGRICACGGSGTCAGPYSNPSTNRTYTATTLATNTFSISSNASITVNGYTGACNPQPTYNHPHYVQIIRVSDGAVVAQGNNGGYVWQGACWTQTSSTTNATVGPGTYTTRLVSQQNCSDSNRCSWGYNASISCY